MKNANQSDLTIYFVSNFQKLKEQFGADATKLISEIENENLNIDYSKGTDFDLPISNIAFNLLILKYFIEQYGKLSGEFFAKGVSQGFIDAIRSFEAYYERAVRKLFFKFGTKYIHYGDSMNHEDFGNAEVYKLLLQFEPFGVEMGWEKILTAYDQITKAADYSSKKNSKLRAEKSLREIENVNREGTIPKEFMRNAKDSHQNLINKINKINESNPYIKYFTWEEADDEWQFCDKYGQGIENYYESKISYDRENTLKYLEYVPHEDDANHENKFMAFELDAVIGNDIRGKARRQKLIPFVNIPSELFCKIDDTAKNNLYIYLGEIHSTFVSGNFKSCYAMMRAFLEGVLREFYGMEAISIQVKDSSEKPKYSFIESIKSIEHKLPIEMNFQICWSLIQEANEILHDALKPQNLPNIATEKAKENKIVKYFNGFRALIDGNSN